MNIIKNNGDRVPYDPSKISSSIKRTGAADRIVKHVVEKVSNRVKDGMTTAKVYAIVREELKEEDLCTACRYNLRNAILRFGPTGFLFEQYVTSVLKSHTYDAHVPEEELEGSCVKHEVDVIAEKNGRRMFIEAKFRHEYKGVVNLKDTMATWSRFLDLVDGAALGNCPHFDEAWIITNARFSDRATTFGTCKGMHLIGWNYPQGRTFAGMVDYNKLYPITVLDEMTDDEIQQIAETGTTLCREMTELEPDSLAQRTGISPGRAEELIKLCAIVIEGSGVKPEKDKK
jgi:hypothetical protein